MHRVSEADSGPFFAQREIQHKPTKSRNEFFIFSNENTKLICIQREKSLAITASITAVFDSCGICETMF